MEATADTNPGGSVNLSDAALLLEENLPDEGEQEIEDSAEDLSESEEPVSEDDDESQDEDDSDEVDELDEDSEDESPEPEVLTVKVNGQETQVTLDELKSGYSRTADYTKKTQELAAQRQAFEQELQAVSSERQKYGELLGVLQAQLQQESEPDWDTLRQTDPIEYSLQMADWQRKQQKLAAVQQEQMQLQQLTQVQQQRQMAEKIQREQEALAKLIPEWTDKEKGKTARALIREQGQKLGFTEQELQQVFDHRAVVALHKAAKYDALMAKRGSVKAEKPSKTMKPGSKAPVITDVKRAKQNFAKSGDIRSAVQFLNLLEK